ncbi:response regulator [Cyanobacteria bacterium FACHB-DQ100]|nr:response regulator [Cyanobacteria bacterium FACHB-DQ100]
MRGRFFVERFILVLEENPEHTLLIQSAFQQDAFQVKVIADGTSAINFLQRRGEYSEAPRPDLILLDLNLPGKSGQEILTELKSDPKLRRIPVVILTSSDREEEIFQSYTLQGNSYVIKASDRDQLSQIIQRIKDFWLGIVTLPLE